MTIDSYSALQDAIGDFLMRQDLVAAIPTFIQLGEASIARDIRDWRMEQRVVLTPADGFVPLPANWVETIRLNAQGAGEIRQVGPVDMMDLRDTIKGGGPPYYFTHSAGQIEIYPAPGDVELLYRAKVPALSDLEPTNWLLVAAPDVYLYAALVHTAPYLQDDPRVQVWGSLYGAASSAINRASEAARHSGPLRMRVK